jgi:hypothetical protein
VRKIEDFFTNSIFMAEIKIGVWCAMRARGVTGPFFYDGTVNAVRYVNNKIRLFFIELLQEEEVYGFSSRYCRKRRYTVFPARFCNPS